MQSRLFKIPNFPSRLWIGKNLEVYIAQDQHFKIQILDLMIYWEKLCPNLSLTVDNKIGNSQKKGWSHFKLNINDWDILFPKILRIYQWIGKNIFHWGKCDKPIWEFCPYHRIFGQKAKYLFLAYVYVALENELKRLVKC